ncbi:MAG: Holliday junction branch migration protein RuvA [Aggregatilineales bacterium]
MIDLLSGQVASLAKDSLVVLVGGVGFRVYVTKTVFDTVNAPGQTVTLFTHLQVREDSLTLFGFLTEDERTIFELLLTVNGVGPKVATAILSALSVDHLRAAVTRDEPQILTRAPGVGKKTAEKIVFELKNKLGAGGIPAVIAMSDMDTDVISNLTALGYSLVEAQSALQSIPRGAPSDIEERVRLALQYFA